MKSDTDVTGGMLGMGDGGPTVWASITSAEKVSRVCDERNAALANVLEVIGTVIRRLEDRVEALERKTS